MVHRDHKVGSKGRGRDKDSRDRGKDKGKDAITEPTSSLDLFRVDRRYFRSRQVGELA